MKWCCLPFPLSCQHFLHLHWKCTFTKQLLMHFTSAAFYFVYIWQFNNSQLERFVNVIFWCLQICHCYLTKTLMNVVFSRACWFSKKGYHLIWVQERLILPSLPENTLPACNWTSLECLSPIRRVLKAFLIVCPQLKLDSSKINLTKIVVFVFKLCIFCCLV